MQAVQRRGRAGELGRVWREPRAGHLRARPAARHGLRGGGEHGAQPREVADQDPLPGEEPREALHRGGEVPVHVLRQRHGLVEVPGAVELVQLLVVVELRGRRYPTQEARQEADFLKVLL